MTWNEYLYFAIPSIICWLGAGVTGYLTDKKWISNTLMILGTIIFGAFIVGLWFGQQRPPLRTIGETRLWYSFFLALIGFITYRHWKYTWMLAFSAIVATVFACVNIFKPETFYKSDACFTELLVCTSRYGIYIVVCDVRCIRYCGVYSIIEVG